MKQAASPTLATDVQLFKALGDEVRLKILALLGNGELCVCDIMEVLGLPQSTVSRHLAYLKHSLWVVGRRNGKWMYYRLHPDLPEDPVRKTIQEYIGAIPELQAEHEKLKTYLENKKSKRRCS